MAFRLRTGLSFCMIGQRAVFLDTGADRYFALPDIQNAHFTALVAGETPAPDAIDTLCRLRVLVPSPHPEHPVPPSVAPVIQQASAVSTGPFELSPTARAIWIQRWIERRLRRVGLTRVLSDLATTLARVPFTEKEIGPVAATMIRGFEHARLLRSAADRCLPRSIALAVCLARSGCRAQVVLAVKLSSFAAHCWVQRGDMVLNDTPEEIARYTPILVI